MIGFVFTPVQWTALINHQEIVSKIQTVATLDVDVIELSQQRRFEAIDLLAYLPVSRMRENQCLAARLCDALGTSVSSLLKAEHRVLSPHIAHDLLFPLAYALHIDDMIDMMADRRRIDIACVFNDFEHAFFWDPPDMPPDVANAVAFQALQKRGISLRFLHAPRPPARERPANRTHEWHEACRIPDTTGARIALLQGLNWSEAAELIKRAETGRLSKPIYAISRAWFNYIDIEMPYSQSQLRSAVESSVQEVCGSDSRLVKVFCNSTLKFLWDAWANMIGVCVRSFELGRWLATALRPATLIQGYDVGGPERCIAEGALAAGVKPVSILHGGTNGIEQQGPRHRAAVGHLAVWSERDALLLRPYRNPAFRVEPTGSLRADLLRSAEASSCAPRAGERRMSHPYVLFLVCSVAEQYEFSVSFDRHVAVWRELRQLCARRTDWLFALKRHPRYDHSAIYGLGGGSLPGNFIIENGSLDDALKKADVVVLPNVETTAALEAMLRGIPVVFLDAAARFDSPTWLRTCGIKIVTDVTSLETELENLLSDTRLRAEYAGQCARLARAASPKAGDEAVDAFCKFLDQVESVPRAQIGSGEMDKVAMWMLDFARWVDERMMYNPLAQPPRPPGGRALRSAKARVNWPHFGRQVIDRIVWYPWSPRVGSSSAALWRAYRSLPRAARPPFFWVRTYLLEALRRECADPQMPSRIRRCRRLAAAALSPRSLRDPAFSVKDLRS